MHMKKKENQYKILQSQIPMKEKWLFKNKAHLKKVKKGLEDAASGRVKSLGSFTKYTDDNE